MDKKISQLSKLFSIIIFTLIIIMILKTTSAVGVDKYSCNTTMFADNSTYEANLYNLFTSLSSKATNPSGYHQATSGKTTGNTASEVVYGVFLCRGDQNTTSCHDCVTSATTTDLTNNCPNRKEAVIWYEECMVRYSNRPFFGKLETQPYVEYANLYNVTGDINKFQKFLGNMINNEVAVRASDGGSQKKYATDTKKYTILKTVYGLGQCTPDLSRGDCISCLKTGFQTLQTYRKGARVYLPSCNLRYETYPFFGLSSPSKPTSLVNSGVLV